MSQLWLPAMLRPAAAALSPVATRQLLEDAFAATMHMPALTAAAVARLRAEEEAAVRTAGGVAGGAAGSGAPAAPQLLSLVARALYGLHRFDAAQALLGTLRARDPHRLEDADTLSNILFVKGDRPALAALAEEAWRSDRYRPETCVAVGNFYSLRGEHDKAVGAFRRALRVDPRYGTAWTLLGHEYVELRNLPAACEAYRRATEADAADYRAWYGLGQAYELLGLPLYALYYYKRAVGVRPRDARMWCALASCYETLERRADALACLERACAEGEGGGRAPITPQVLYSALLFPVTMLLTKVLGEAAGEEETEMGKGKEANCLLALECGEECEDRTYNNGEWGGQEHSIFSSGGRGGSGARGGSGGSRGSRSGGGGVGGGAQI
jgi:tetratricopeptide (TPR) repeat protein